MNSLPSVPVFFHIEKAAGTTFHDILRNNFVFYVILLPFSDDQINKKIGLPEVQRLFKYLPKMHGFGGHPIKPFLSYEESSQKYSLDRIVFLREPVSRYLSHYLYQKEVMGINWTIDDFLSDERYSNFMTKRISGGGDVDLAMKILSQFDFVGLTEFFEESLILMRERVPGIEKINFEVRNHRNQRKRSQREEFSQDVLDRVAGVNELDIQLYQFAEKNLFQQYRDSHSGCLAKDLNEFIESNANFKYTSGKRLFWRLYKYLYTDKIQKLISL